jgi:hypothetical protein
MQAQKIDDLLLDADDAWVEFTDDIMQSEENELGEMYFKEGFNRGVEAFRSQALTLLDKLKD